MQAAPVPANAAEAMAMLNAAFGHLSETDWVAMGCQVQGEILAGLRGTQSQLTAVQAQVLAAFSAAGGHEPDGHASARQWLIGKTGITRGAANGAIGWSKRLGRHAVIAAAMAGRAVSESWAREIASWTDQLPVPERDKADAILLQAPPRACHWKTWRCWRGRSSRRGGPGTPTPTTAMARPGTRTALPPART